MATVYGIEVAGEIYDIEDTNARQGVDTNANDIDEIEGKIPASASSSNKLATQEDINLPPGIIIAFGGSSAPNGWLLCQGQAVSRTEYKNLFDVIGTAFGNGDGSTTFNLPDLREATTKGIGLTSKSVYHYNDSGLTLGQFIDDRVQSHEHSQRGDWGTGSVDAIVIAGNKTSPDAHIMGTTTNQTGRKGTTTEVKAVGVNYIIRI